MAAHQSKWKDEFYVDVYELARHGVSEARIAAKIGVTPQAFAKWKKNRPALVDAIERGRRREKRSAAEDYVDFLKNRLSEEAKETLDRLTEYQAEGNPIAKIERLFAKHGKQARQLAFLLALPANAWNVARACRAANVDRSTFDRWAVNDADFARLVAEAYEARKDAYEEFLYRASEAGDVSAILFANRTLNRDRGYSDKVEIEKTVNHRHVHVHSIDVGSLPLGLKTRKRLLAAARKAGLVPEDPAAEEETGTETGETGDVDARPKRTA